MSVDSGAAVIDAPQTDTVAVTDDALGAVWDKFERDNGAERAEDGKFASPGKTEADVEEVSPADGPEPLEGGEGEEAGDGDSTVTASSVPLPASMIGLEEVWDKIPDDLQKPIAEHQAKLHRTLSDQGRALATWKPIADTIKDFGEYFDGRKANFAPDAAIRAVFETVRDLDANPVETLISLANDYKVLPKLAAAFRLEGDEAAQSGTQNAELVAKIGELENTIRALQSGFKPEAVDESVSRILFEKDELRSAQDAISRTSQEMPLLDAVPEDDMVHFIHRVKNKAAQTATSMTKEAVLKAAYDMAVNADPELRARAAALKGAAVDESGKVAAQKQANAANLKSMSAGKAREPSEDELLGSIYDKHAKG